MALDSPASKRPETTVLPVLLTESFSQHFPERSNPAPSPKCQCWEHVRVNDFRQDCDSFPTLKLGEGGRGAGGGRKHVQRPPGTKLHLWSGCMHASRKERRENSTHSNFCLLFGHWIHHEIMYKRWLNYSANRLSFSLCCTCATFGHKVTGSVSLPLVVVPTSFSSP